jgi:hypothetical protein
VGSSAVGDVGQASHFGFSLLAYEALGAASTSVFLVALASDPTPPSHEQVVSLRTIGLSMAGPPPLDEDPPLDDPPLDDPPLLPELPASGPLFAELDVPQ